jgi:hypothetical protein
MVDLQRSVLQNIILNIFVINLSKLFKSIVSLPHWLTFYVIRVIIKTIFSSFELERI